MNELIAASLDPQRFFNDSLLGAFAPVALLLASLVISVSFISGGQRTHESAFGHSPLARNKATFWRLVLNHGLKMALAGSRAGTDVSLGWTRLLAKSAISASARPHPKTFVIHSVLKDRGAAGLLCSRMEGDAGVESAGGVRTQ